MCVLSRRDTCALRAAGISRMPARIIKHFQSKKPSAPGSGALGCNFCGLFDAFTLSANQENAIYANNDSCCIGIDARFGFQTKVSRFMRL